MADKRKGDHDEPEFDLDLPDVRKRVVKPSEPEWMEELFEAPEVLPSREAAKKDPQRAAKKANLSRVERAQPKQRSGRGLLVFILVLLMALGVYGFLNTDMFSLSRVIVRGTERLDSDAVIAQSGAPMGLNVFKLDTKGITANLMQHPYIKSVKLQRRFPDVLVINVTERQPWAVLQYIDSFLVIDDSGTIMEVSSTMVYPGCPLASGVNITSFNEGSIVTAEDDYVLETLMQMLQALQTDGSIGMISEINMTDSNNIRMVSREGVILRLGQGWEIPDKIRWVRALLDDIRAQGYVGGTVDLTSAKAPVYRRPGLEFDDEGPVVFEDDEVTFGETEDAPEDTVAPDDDGDGVGNSGDGESDEGDEGETDGGIE